MRKHAEVLKRKTANGKKNGVAGLGFHNAIINTIFQLLVFL